MTATGAPASPRPRTRLPSPLVAVVNTALALAGALALVACSSEPRHEREREPSNGLLAEDDEPISPLPLEREAEPVRAALGEALFREPALSGDGKVACADCHFSDRALTDGKRVPKVADRPEGATNAPTLFNVRYLYRLTWAAKFETLETHLDGLIKNPSVMAGTWDKAADHLRRQNGWSERFAAAYSDGLTPANVRASLLEYERSLVSPSSAFDRWLRGDEEAINQRAKDGYALFKTYGCISCHQGMMVGGNLLQRFGVMRDYFADRGGVTAGDLGRFNVTQREEDRHVFRVPSLRNVAKTAPYFHDGSATTLPQAIKVMGRYQLGRDLSAEDVDSIEAFLEALTGEYRGKQL